MANTYTATFIAKIRKSSTPVFRVVTQQATSEADFLNDVFDMYAKGCWEFRITSCKCIS